MRFTEHFLWLRMIFYKRQAFDDWNLSVFEIVLPPRTFFVCVHCTRGILRVIGKHNRITDSSIIRCLYVCTCIYSASVQKPWFTSVISACKHSPEYQIHLIPSQNPNPLPYIVWRHLSPVLRSKHLPAGVTCATSKSEWKISVTSLDWE